MRYLASIKPLVAASALALCAGAVQAEVKAYHVRPGNFTFTTATALVPVNAAGETTVVWSQTAAGKKLLTFSAECSVDAPAGNNFAWIDLDILWNGVVQVPTVGASDAFCSADGVAGYGGYTRSSITIVINGIAGNNFVAIRARLNAGATGGWLGDGALVVFD